MPSQSNVRWLCLGDGRRIRFDEQKHDIHFVDGDNAQWDDQTKTSAARTLAWAIGGCRVSQGKDRGTIAALLLNSRKLTDETQNPDDQMRLAIFALEIFSLAPSITIEGLLVA
ncbi:MAG: hypothetical protein ACREO5_14600 [Candidatus Binatia bacterium]